MEILFPVSIESFLKVGALVFAALVLSKTILKDSIGLTKAMWALVTTILLVLPLSYIFLPQLEIDIALENLLVAPSSNEVNPVYEATRTVSKNNLFSDSQIHTDSSSSSIKNLASRILQTGFNSYLTALWAIGFLLSLVRLLFSFKYYFAVSRNSRFLQSNELSLISHLSDSTQSKLAKTPIFVSDQIFTPITIGILQPRIIIPTKSFGWGSEKLQSTLLHELSHVRGFDNFFRFLGQIATSIYWFHPFAHLAISNLRISQEKAADEFAVSSGIAPIDYAQYLVEFAAYGTTLKLGTPAAAEMAEHSTIKARVKQILTYKKSSATTHGRGQLVRYATLAVFLFPFLFFRFTNAQSTISDIGLEAPIDNVVSVSNTETLLESAVDAARRDVSQDMIEYSLLSVRNVRRRSSFSNPLHIAIEHEETEWIEQLIHQGVDLNKIERFGISPVFLAVSKGNLDVVELLITSGANVNLDTPYGTTPLHLAAQLNLVDIAQSLLHANASISSRTIAGETPEATAIRLGHTEIVQSIRSL